MQFKPVPPASNSLEFLETVRRAVPRDPEDTDDCCARLVDRTEIESRDAAAEWLTFLRALELATEQAAGFARTQVDLDLDELQRTFRDRLYGADELLARLEEADEPLSATAVATRLEAAGRGDERHERSSRLEARREERIERLLEWAVLLELVERTDGGYRHE
ncbi:hypothetical protein CV102_24940 [Natronococcus pandeyae]|uniref:Uncharacterized protein n=1 Tax=Natronococcus pandeyae TaxID=2055836 RepID=A0A8J8Q2M6_9EURY|nr:hypothetical protein [Natronococcus pandeyae]TYL36000.1 hypothetical protein CV102_24940 [Natronococcus pandeyae]